MRRYNTFPIGTAMAEEQNKHIDITSQIIAGANAMVKSPISENVGLPSQRSLRS